MLHPEIPPENFARHISPELPDPVRLRQILVYSIKREMECLNKSDPLQSVIGEVFEEVYQDLLQKKINTSWYHREVCLVLNARHSLA